MDKNTLVGFVLIGAVLVGFSLLNRPNAEQVEQMKRQNDSTQAVAKRQEAIQEAEKGSQAEMAAIAPANIIDSTALFYHAEQGEQAFTTIDNDLLTLTLDNKGGRVYSVLLKKYNGQDAKPLVLFDGKDASMNFLFYNKKEAIETDNYYFTALNKTDSTVTMRLTADSTSYIDFVYVMHANSYMIDFEIQAVGMEKLLSSNTNLVDIEWKQRAHQIEKGYAFENRYSTLSYKFQGDKTDNLSESKDAEESVPGRLNWIAFKNQFFSSVFIADQSFEKNILKSKHESKESGYLKDYSAEMSTFFDPSGKEVTKMQFYFGPNHYKTLKAIDELRADNEKLELDQLVPLGWSFFRWINKVFTINLFNWLSGWGLSMGIVLLLMTIIVKLVIFPFTYKSYMSSARMRVLKPQIDVITKKYPNKEDAMKRQQETMGLYSKYGVSPMSGCLPMLLQMPIIFALFMFVPTAIELRQQSFLWAPDLSTYDAFITWDMNIPFIGNHLSLFCLLMCVTNIINTKFTMAQQDTGQSMPGMKTMMYIMPIMFIFILNDYAAGLNYYYFISTLISIIIMIVLKKTTNEEKLLAQLEANKAKPKKKSGLMAKMAEMQKKQEQMMKDKNNKR